MAETRKPISSIEKLVALSNAIVCERKILRAIWDNSASIRIGLNDRIYDAEQEAKQFIDESVDKAKREAHKFYGLVYENKRKTAYERFTKEINNLKTTALFQITELEEKKIEIAINLNMPLSIKEVYRMMAYHTLVDLGVIK